MRARGPRLWKHRGGSSPRRVGGVVTARASPIHPPPQSPLPRTLGAISNKQLFRVRSPCVHSLPGDTLELTRNSPPGRWQPKNTGYHPKNLRADGVPVQKGDLPPARRSAVLQVPEARGRGSLIHGHGNAKGYYHRERFQGNRINPPTKQHGGLFPRTVRGR